MAETYEHLRKRASSQACTIAKQIKQNKVKDAIIYAALLDFAAIISWELGRLGGTDKDSGAIKLSREARTRIEQTLKGSN